MVSGGERRDEEVRRSTHAGHHAMLDRVFDDEDGLGAHTVQEGQAVCRSVKVGLGGKTRRKRRRRRHKGGKESAAETAKNIQCGGKGRRLRQKSRTRRGEKKSGEKATARWKGCARRVVERGKKQKKDKPRRLHKRG